MIDVRNGNTNGPVSEAVLFAFDDHSLEFTTGLKLELVPGKEPGQANPIVLRRGADGSSDDVAVRYYGAVAEVDGQLRMWYESIGSQPPQGGRRINYAVSDDGENWEKPDLGLVEYGGSTANNIVGLFGGDPVISAAPVIYDPADPDESRRFKMVIESGRYGNRFAVAFSADGLTWQAPDFNPVGPPLEMAGLLRWGDAYYVNGQDEFGWHGSQYGRARKLVTFASYDFERWTQASAMGFRRDNLPPRQVMYNWNTAEEVHLGTCTWDRGNVVVGLYGMWHGTPTGNRRFITMDIGLLVSQNALHYREPVPDYLYIPALEELELPMGASPALMQGQGMLNRGERTMFWYEVWASSDVRLATWERDRLGYLQVFKEKQLVELPEPHVLSCVLRPTGDAEVSLNVAGLGEHTEVSVELLGEDFRPLPGFSGDEAAVVATDGLDVAVRWGKGAAVPAAVGDGSGGSAGGYRVQVTFRGVRAEDARLYSIYVRDSTA